MTSRTVEPPPPAKPVDLLIQCPPLCQFHPDKLEKGEANVLKLVRLNGAGARVWGKRASELLGRPINLNSVSRHLHHYKEVFDGPPADSDGQATGPRPSDVEILDELIVAGWRNSRNWRPTIRDTLEAMKLKSSMTGNSAFENMLKAMEEGLQMAEGDDSTEGTDWGNPEEAPEALAAEDERGDDDTGE